MARIIRRVGPHFSVAIRKNEFLNPFSRIHLSRIEVSFRIHGDRVDPVELAGHAAVIADGSLQLSGHAIVNPNLVICAVGDHHILAVGIVRKGQIVSRSAHAVHGRARAAAFHSPRRRGRMDEKAGHKLPLAW